MVYGELVLKGFIVSVQNHLDLLNQLHNAISFLNFGLFSFWLNYNTNFLKSKIPNS